MHARLNVALSSAVAVALASPISIRVAAAQEAEGLEEIVVYARKREENLQGLALSVSAMGAEELSRRFESDLAGFANSSPNLVVDDLQQGPGSPAAIAIRGIGSTDVEKSFDPAVGVVLDGIFIGQGSGSMIKALDLQSMEILRGPQGTLFGRNTIAGVINAMRRRPDTESFGGQARLGYGNYNSLLADGYLNVPLGDSFAFKLNGAYNQNDGYMRNTFLHRTTGDLEYYTLGASFLWKPTDNLDIYFRYDSGNQTQDTPQVNNNAQPDQPVCSAFGQCAKNLHTPQAGDRRKSVANGFDPNASFDTDLYVLDAIWRLTDAYTLDFLYGHLGTDEKAYQDWDGTPFLIYHTDRPANYDQDSYELRLTYATDSKLTYTLGAYYWDSEYEIRLKSYIGPDTFPQTVRQTTTSYALFFEGDYAFTDAFKLTLGGRYTDDKKESGVWDPIYNPQLETEGGSLQHPSEESWNKFTPKIALTYQFEPELMGYVLYSEGYRSGGFSGRANTYEAMVTPYDPETVDNYELGMKSEWLDNRLRFNATAFYMEYNDKQEEQSYPIEGGTGQQTLILNASTAEIYGLELELVAAPVDGLTISATLGTIDAKYKNFKDPVTGANLDYLDLRRAPKLTSNLEPVYTWEALGGQMTARASWHYVAAMEMSFWNSPQTKNSAQNIIDASLGYQRNNTMITLWGTNLTDEDSYTVGFDVGANPTLDPPAPGIWSYTATRPPRLYGLQISQKF